MNAAETIQAAIDDLEGQRSAATSGPWDSGLVGVYGPDGYVAADDDMWTADRILIVTLHRTIDAQLAILRMERGIAGALGDRYGANDGSTDKAILDLARAILGEVA